jgi:SAM-dependent methyltransferase
LSIEVAFGRRFARLVTNAVVRRPSLWRLFSRPLRTQFERLAPQWDTMRAAQAFEPLEAALQTLPAPERALDLGTGTGRAATLIALRFPEASVVGLDLAEAMVAEARRNLPPELQGRVRFEQGDAAHLPYDDGAFDLVALANMIPFFDELARVLTARGTLLVCFSEGAGTPIWVPPERLRAELERRGFTCVAGFAAGAATCLLARRSVGAAAPPAEC